MAISEDVHGLILEADSTDKLIQRVIARHALNQLEISSEQLAMSNLIANCSLLIKKAPRTVGAFCLQKMFVQSSSISAASTASSGSAKPKMTFIRELPYLPTIIKLIITAKSICS